MLLPIAVDARRRTRGAKPRSKMFALLVMLRSLFVSDVETTKVRLGDQRNLHEA